MLPVPDSMYLLSRWYTDISLGVGWLLSCFPSLQRVNQQLMERLPCVRFCSGLSRYAAEQNRGSSCPMGAWICVGPGWARGAWKDVGVPKAPLLVQPSSVMFPELSGRAKTISWLCVLWSLGVPHYFHLWAPFLYSIHEEAKGVW